MSFDRLRILLGFLVLGLALTGLPGPASADVIRDPVTPTFSGTGLGNQLTVLTIQEAGQGSGTGMASGCVTRSGAADMIGGCAAPFDGADESMGASQTLTRTFGEIGWGGPEDIGFVFNANEPAGNAITLEDLSLFFFLPDGSLFFEAALAASQAFADTDTGTGSSGFLFSLDLAQQTSLLPLFTSLASPNNRVGAGMAVSDAQGGPDTLFALDLQRTTQIPEPASLFLVGTGLLGLGLARRRRRREK